MVMAESSLSEVEEEEDLRTTGCAARIAVSVVEAMASGSELA